MTSKLKLLVASGAITAALMNATAAYAVGTTQGTDITNNVSVAYTVGTTPQTAVTAANTFKVDRKVIFALDEVGATTTSVQPGQTGQITTFVLTNTSNDVLDFSITAGQIATGAATPTGMDAFDLVVGPPPVSTPAMLICLDADSNSICDTTATATLTVNDLSGATGTVRILVVGNIPANATNGQKAGVTLTATALKGDGAAFVSGTDYGNGVVNVANTVQTVFAEAASSGAYGVSPANDGVDIAFDDYTVSAAQLSVFKSSRVVTDNIAGSADTTNPKSVPGATVEYCISVANASGGATATGISISDLLPIETTYVANSIMLNGTVTNPGSGQTCSGGTAGGTFTDNTAPTKDVVAGTLSDIAGGAARALIFRVTIN